MKNQLFTKHSFLGILISLVLAFSVQDIADALTLTEVSDKVQSNIETAEFEISFSVGLKSDTTAIKNDDGKLIKDSTATGGAANARIDSQGYLVVPKDGVDRRTTTVTLATLQSRAPTSHSSDIQAKRGNDYIDPAGTAILADSGKNAYDNNGLPLYYYRDAVAGVDANNDGDFIDDGDTKPVTAQAGSRVKILQEEFAARVPNANRYHYNDEAIAISVDANMSVRLKSGSTSYPVTTFTTAPTTRATALSTTTASLWEGGGIRSLPSSITLLCTSATAGTYTVTITDVSPESDFPSNAPETLEQTSITFTLYVEDDAAPTGSLNFNQATGSLLRLDTAKSIEPIHTHFNLTDESLNNKSIRYKVTTGSGLLYVGTPTREDTTPISDLTIHKDASVYLKVNQTDNEVVAAIAGQDLRTHGKTLVFKYTGTDRRTTTTQTTTTTPTTTTTTTPTTTTTTPAATTLTVSPTSISAAAGSTQTLTVTAPATATVSVGYLLDSFRTGGGTASPASGTGSLTSTLTLPSTAGTYTLTVFAGTESQTVSVTVTGATTTTTTTIGTLSLAFVGTQTNGQQAIQVTAQTTAGALVTTPVTVTLSGAGISKTVSTTATGSVNTIIALPATAATLTASAAGYTSGTLTLPARTTTTPTTTTTTTTPTTTTTTGGEPSRITISGLATHSGTVNQQLDLPLSVRILDANGTGVANARVTFRVRTGQGRLSQRGNGRAVAATTNTQGLASADYTPLSASSTVVASVRGVSETVTFTITTDGSTPTTTTPTGDTPRTTTITPVVKVKAANRPPMLWVDGGGIYALVGADAQRFAPSVENALNLAIGGNKVYWTEKTGESAGTINAANLDGTGVKELKSIMAVPMGIAVDTAGSKLYWTNSRGRIQSANLDGSGIQNVLQNLSTPMDIALADGNAYWTEATGAVKYVNLTGPKNVRNISTGTDPAGSLAIAGGKVYWTERTGESAGTINSANLNGTGAKELNDIRAVPMGIAVDGSRSKLYWTNSRGRIQSADLDGSGIRNVVEGLGMPGDMVISNSITAPAAATSIQTAPTASGSKYDLNNDGSVDSDDVDVLLLAVLAEVTTAKYDLNGDGDVDVKDVSVLNKNLDKGAATAPTLLGRKFSALEVDRLQEQVDLLIATGDRSPAAMKTLIYLQQLIAMARPEKTQLLANYPNPFNPETWIPYELATDTNVTLTIYTAQGVVIRVLHLGQQAAGYYTDRQRAAYWDGRNALGEQVASGIYFYQLQTDTLSSLRKMVILK